MTVSFETVGGSAIPSQTVAEGGTATRPEDPTKANSLFIDWYTTQTYDGQPYDFNSPVYSDLTLYAKWNDNNYAVVFDVNGGAPLIEYSTKWHGETVTAPTEPTRPGYTFTGWYTDVACTQEADFPYTVTENTQFYAGWRSDSDTITVRLMRAIHGSDDFDDINLVIDELTIKPGEKIE